MRALITRPREDSETLARALAEDPPAVQTGNLVHGQAALDVRWFCRYRW